MSKNGGVFLRQLHEILSEDNKIKSIETMLNQVLLLKSTLENLPHLRDVLNCYKSEIFVNISNILKDPRFDQMLTEIKKVIQPEVQSIKATTQCFQRIYAIKSGICEYLDFMRTIYSNLIEVMRGTVSDLAVKLGLPLRMIYAVSKGFHMQLTFSSKNPRISIPSGLDIIYQRGNNYYLTNPDLYKLNVRVSDVIDELHLASYRIARNLVENLLNNADANYELVSAVSKLDIILSLAKASARSGYCCPKFGRETRVVGAIYPFLEYTSSQPMPVPNNIIGTPDYNFYIITGPNMGGKTLYIKTIAVLQIMAQMKEFQYIFAKITPNSLVFIDEICRNTNPEEGKLIALKICKSLASIGIQQINQANKKTNEKKSEQTTNLLDATLPFIYLTTHFLELTKSADDFLNISNLFLHAEQNVVEDRLHLTYTHKVMEGVTPIRGYGLALARTVRFPPGVIERAEEIYQQLLINDKDNLQTENGFPPRNTSHPIIVNLEESIRNITQPMHHQTAPILKTVPSFLNKSVPNGSQNDSSCLENKSGLLELNAEFYDVFAQIASTLRDKLPECQEKCKDLVENFIKRQPAELLDAIYQIKKQDFDDLTSCSICNAEAISGDKSTFTIERTNLLDLSFHSLVRRLGCDDSKDALRTLPCTPSAVSNLSEFYRYTPLTDIRSYISVTPLIESIASGYAQTCPVNTHNKLSARTYEIETGHLTFPMRRRAFNFQNSNYPKATQSNSDCNSSVLQLQKLVRKANVTSTNETSQSFQPLSYNESVSSQDQIKKIGNLSSLDFGSGYSSAENHNLGKLQKVHLKYGKKSRTIWRKIEKS
ncbi:unnamed protein product [Hermetia illucens]|uniref:MutS-like protein n=1 Tax=Hermetia illucens TaxID=343691 RepID=A0A7R8Z124_HERIL|nr:unnamed protein product [Hermetia illucens]